MNAIETEMHLLLICPNYTNLRRQFITPYYCRWPTVLKLNIKHFSIPKCKIVVWKKKKFILYVKILLLYLMLNSAQFIISMVLAISICLFYAKCYVYSIVQRVTYNITFGCDFGIVLLPNYTIILVGSICNICRYCMLNFRW